MSFRFKIRKSDENIFKQFLKYNFDFIQKDCFVIQDCQSQQDIGTSNSGSVTVVAVITVAYYQLNYSIWRNEQKKLKTKMKYLIIFSFHN